MIGRCGPPLPSVGVVAGTGGRGGVGGGTVDANGHCQRHCISTSAPVAGAPAHTICQLRMFRFSSLSPHPQTSPPFRPHEESPSIYPPAYNCSLHQLTVWVRGSIYWVGVEGFSLKFLPTKNKKK